VEQLEDMEMLAYDYPLMGVFLSMLWFFLWVIWIMLLFRVIGDVFRSHDMGGFAKALWLLLVIALPFFGVFVYLIARGHAMAQRDMNAAQAREQEFKAYVQQTASASPSGSADELAKLAELNQSGVLTDAEFAQQKAKILA
jgi:type VI protein secretion system component VasK